MRQRKLAKRSEKKKLPMLGMRAEFLLETLNDEARTVDVVFTTGARVRRGFWTEFDEELEVSKKAMRLDRLNSGAPVLADHISALAFQRGVVDKAWIDGKLGMATLRFAKAEDDPEAEKLFGKVKDRIVRNVSVGYRVYKYEEVGDAKTDAEEGRVPVYRAVDWEPHEISFVPIGADAEAQTRSQPSAKDEKRTFDCLLVREEIMTKAEKLKLKAKLRAAEADESEEEERELDEEEEGEESRSESEETETEEERAEGDAEDEEETEEEKRSAKRSAKGAKAVTNKAIETERKRSSEIMDSAEAAGVDLSFARKLVQDGTSVAQARGLIIKEMASRTANPIKPAVSVAARAEVTQDETDKWRDGASQWIMQRAGGDVAKVVEKHSGKTLDGGEFRGLSLLDLARESLERSGVKVRGMNKMDMVGKAFTHRSGGMNTSSDFGVLLENVMHKILLAQYAFTADTWTRFCSRGSVSDFRAHNRYRQGTFGVLDTVLEHGEFKNKSIPDGAKEQITAKTKGNIIALSRQAIINDDMGAFNDLAMRLGRAAKLSVESDVYALLALNSGLGPNMADGLPLFDAGHANLGVGSTIGVAGLDADRVVMGLQKDPSNNEILDLRPAILLVSLGLGGEARVINDAQYDPDTANKLQRPNKVRGLFSDIVDTARLSGNRRYLFAAPSIAPTLEVAFLDGIDTPFLESKDGFRIDGVEWKVRLDYGVGAVDYRGAVTNIGTGG